MIDGVIVARFQFAVLPSELQQLIHSVLTRHHNVILMLGEAPIPGSLNNPLSFAARKAMIHQNFPNLTVLSIRDIPSDETWSSRLDQLLLDQNVGSSAVIYGSEARFISRYSGKFRTDRLPRNSDARLTNEITEDPQSVSFRQGRVHAFQTNYPKVYPTVDIAVFREGKSALLLGKKSIDGLWRLPGGFVDPEDTSYEAAAKRELREETGLDVKTDFTIEQSFKVDDWRYRYEHDKIITTLFSVDILNGDPAASDDLAEVKWFTLQEVQALAGAGETVSEHLPMIQFLLKKYLD